MQKLPSKVILFITGPVLLSYFQAAQKYTNSPSSTATCILNYILGLPKFAPTDSPELDEIFLTFRQKYFTPHALSRDHRKLIYKPQYRQLLSNDPGVTVTLSDGEEVRLMPTNPYDKPPKAPALKRISELLQESTDPVRWRNLPAFLEGMVISREPLPENWLEKTVRKAHENGQLGTIIRCAEMVERTGFSLARPAITRELMLGLHENAARAGWEGSGLEKAARQAHQVSRMLEHPLHCGKSKEGQPDLRRDVWVTGVVFELTAAKSLYLDGGQDVSGKTHLLATRLLALDKVTQLQQAGMPPEKELELRIPLWHGLKIAHKLESISSSGIEKDLNLYLKKIDEEVQTLKKEAEATAGEKPKRALLMLKELKEI